jgi:hypothetical protein
MSSPNLSIRAIDNQVNRDTTNLTIPRTDVRLQAIRMVMAGRGMGTELRQSRRRELELDMEPELDHRQSSRV